MHIKVVGTVIKHIKETSGTWWSLSRTALFLVLLARWNAYCALTVLNFGPCFAGIYTSIILTACVEFHNWYFPLGL